MEGGKKEERMGGRKSYEEKWRERTFERGRRDKEEGGRKRRRKEEIKARERMKRRLKRDT